MDNIKIKKFSCFSLKHSFLQMQKLATSWLPRGREIDGGQLKNFNKESASCCLSLKRSFQDKNFDKSHFLVHRLLKELLDVPESILYQLYFGNAHFGKLCKTYSMNFVCQIYWRTLVFKKKQAERHNHLRDNQAMNFNNNFILLYIFHFRIPV